jgi:hypothetical protein
VVKLAVFGHHHLLRRSCELRVVGDQRCIETKGPAMEAGPWIFYPAPWASCRPLS